MNQEQRVAVISSTAFDLAEHRRMAREACIAARFFPRWMENLTAQDRDAIRVSKKLVQGDKREKEPCADVYIGIYAHRYGYVPDGYDVSITEMEFDCAVKKGVEILVFLIDKDHPVREDWVERGDIPTKKLEAFKQRACTNRIRGCFKSAEELRRQVYEALTTILFRELFKKDSVIAELKRENSLLKEQIANADASAAGKALTKVKAKSKARYKPPRPQ